MKALGLECRKEAQEAQENSVNEAELPNPKSEMKPPPNVGGHSDT